MDLSMKKITKKASACDSNWEMIPEIDLYDWQRIRNECWYEEIKCRPHKNKNWLWKEKKIYNCVEFVAMSVCVLLNAS